jgi:uncharacterized protein
MLTNFVNFEYKGRMTDLLEALTRPWPWYVAGPALGLVVPLLLLLGNRAFGLSSNLQHACAALGMRDSYFAYDWRRVGGWNLLVFAGIAVGGLIGGVLLASPGGVGISAATQRDLAALGVGLDDALAPTALFGARALLGPAALAALVGGLLIGFGTRWAAGCTSGHAIMGLAARQWPSLVAVVGFFLGGLVMTHLVLPWLLPLLTGGGPS